MAIVNRKPKGPLFQVNHNLGPGSYEVDDKLLYEQRPRFSIRKGEKTQPKKEFVTPGPGQYDLAANYAPEKIVMLNEEEGLIVIQREKENAIFKSITPKNEIFDINMETPGPGEYEPIKPKSRKKKYRKQQIIPEVQRESSVLGDLLVNIGYRPTASIPSRSDDKMFFVEEEGEVRECNIKTIHSGQLSKHSRKSNPKPRCSLNSRYSRHQSPSVQRNQNLGPGCYFTEPIFKNKKLNQDLKSTAASAPKLAKTKFRHDSSEMTQYTQEEQEQGEYMKNAVPGPGSYDTSLLSFGSKQTFRKNNNNAFGVLSKRFSEPKVNYINKRNCPQSQIKRIPRRSNQFSIAFGRKTADAEKSVQRHKKLGPGSYAQTQSLSNKLLDNIKKSYQGCFGTTVDRFQPQPKLTEPCSTDFYDSKLQTKPSTANCVFKSGSERKCFGNTPKPQPKKQEFYSQNYNTIQQRTKIKQSEKQDWVVKKPGFNLSTVRFIDKIKQPSAQRQTDKADYSKSFSKLCSNPRAYSIPNAPARYQVPTNQHPGPGNYNCMDQWNSRTFNVLYI